MRFAGRRTGMWGFAALVVILVCSVAPAFAGRIEPGALQDCKGIWINPTNYAQAWFGLSVEEQPEVNQKLYAWVTARLQEQGIPLVDERLAESDPRYAIVSFVGGRASARPEGQCDAFSIQIEIRRKGTLSSRPARPIWAIIYTDGRTGFATGSGLMTSIDSTWRGVIEDFGVEWKQQHSGGQ